MEKYTGWVTTPGYDPEDLDSMPWPAFDLENHLAHVPVMASRGCPFQCAYCASHRLQPKMRHRSPASVVAEIVHWHEKKGVEDFAFYDDALLVASERYVVPVLDGVIRAGLKVRFHTPNAMHIRELSGSLARLMRRAGFHTIRLGLETTAFDTRQDMDRKVTEDEFLRAVSHLKDAGFQPGQVGAYLLAGLPGQDVGGVEESIRVVKAAGVTPVIAHYTPIPHTPMWAAAVAASRYDLEADPIFTNNAIFPCQSETFSWDVLSRLKNLARG